MNYYQRHVGDYLRDTAHLSLLEHGVYSRLLDVYYTREGAIQANQAARLIGARTKDELAAVESVLAEFFDLVDGSWSHSRCDREIELYQAKAAKNREVGKLGGRPRKTPLENNHDGFENNHGGFLQEPRKNHGGSETKPSQEPRTNNQEPIQERAGIGVARDPPPNETSPGLVCRAMRAEGMPDVNPSHPKLLALLKAGMTAPELVDAARHSVVQSPPKSFAYALAVAEGRRRDAANPALPKPSVGGSRYPPSAAQERRDKQAHFTALLLGDAVPGANIIDIETIAKHDDQRSL